MNRFRVCCLLLVVFSGVNLRAQQDIHITLKGSVFDKDAGEPLARASLSIGDRGMGTIANDHGRFELNVPELFINDTLTVTYLGYKTYRRVISEIKGREPLKIPMVPESTLLNAVSVEAVRISADEIIAKAIQAIKQNYPTDAFLVEGFFRDLQKQDGRYVEMSEAALKIYDRNFQRKLNNGITEEVVILEARSSVSYADPLIQQIRKQNAIIDLLDNNPVHYTRGLLNTKYFHYRIDSVLQSQDDWIYIISTIPGNHRIYVAEDNYAIVKTVEEVKATDNFKRPEYGLNDSLLVRRMVHFLAISEFQEYKGKMYLKYSNETDAYEVLSKASRKRKFLVESYKEFVVTRIPDLNAEPFNKKEAASLRQGLETKPYRPDFWNNSSTLQLSPLNPQVLRDLEREVPLKDQFAKIKDQGKSRQ